METMNCNGDKDEEDLHDEEFELTLEDELRGIQNIVGKAMYFIERAQYNSAAYHLGFVHSELRHLINSLEPIEEEEEEDGQENQ